MGQSFLDLDYQPRYPANYNPGIGIIGCGGIVKAAHLPAYTQHNLNIVGVYDISPTATEGVQEKFGVRKVFSSLDELLGHPEIEVVDIATHPAQRVELARRALEAGKHVLAQKPLALDLESARQVVEEAERRGLKVAVNQNGRWAPVWRVATLLVQQGTIGEVLAVTHLHDMRFGWIPGTVFDTIPHFAIYDYSVHWIDAIRCWLEGKEPLAVRAREYRTPHQPPESQADWGMWVDISYTDGSNGLIRGVGCSRTGKPGHPFWIHGTEGVISGSVLGNDFVELEKDGITHRWNLKGQWFPDGFAGTMGELLCAIDEDREPYNSARHNLLSLQMTLSACRSAEQDGAPVSLTVTLP